MSNKEEQIEFFKRESWNYFQRNYQGKNLREIPLSSYLYRTLQSSPINIDDGSILEIGCGAANNLYQLCKRLRARRGVGTDPSPLVVKTLSEVFPELEFYESDTRVLPFTTGEFDVVVLRSVLHWVDRNYLLQTVGEAIRVTSQYLIVSDFAPHQPYSVVYHHAPNYRTFKMSYQPLLEASGFMKCTASLCSNNDDEWNAIQTTLFQKISLEEAFPLREREDFGVR